MVSETIGKIKFRQFIPDRWLISLVISLEVSAFHRQMSPFKCPDAGKYVKHIGDILY